MAAGSIVIDLLMRTGSFETDTKRAGDRIKVFGRDIKSLATIAAGAFTAVLAGTAALVKSAIDAADAMSKQSQAAGVSVESLSALTYAADLSGVSQEELVKSLVKVSAAASEAQQGTASYAEAFDRLGIKVEDADGKLKNSDVLLAEIADKFAGMENGARKTAIATEIFGRAGAKLIPLLNGGSAGLEKMKQEAERLGIVISTEAAVASEAFNDNITRLQTAFRGITYQIAESVVPTLATLSTRLLENARDAGIMRGAFITLFEQLFGGTEPIDLLRDRAEELTRNITYFTEELDRLRVTPGQEDRVTDLTARLATLRQELTTTQAQIALFEKDAAKASAGPATPNAGSGGGEGSGDRKSPRVSEAQRYLEALEKQIQGTKDLTTEETLLEDIQAGRLGKVTAAQREQLVAAAQRLDQLRQIESQLQAEAQQEQDLADFRKAQYEEEERARKAAADAIADAQKRDADAIARIVEEQRSPLEALNVELAEYARLRALVRNEQERSAIDNAELDAWERYSESIKKAAEEIDSFAEVARERIQGFLSDSLADAFEGNFADIEKGFVQLINRMVAEALAAQLSRALFGGSEGDGGLLSGIIKFGTDILFVGARAGGGDVMGGRGYLVGEEGPEIFVPRTAGTVMPNQSLQREAFFVTNNFHISGAPDLRTQQQMAARAGESVQRALARNR